MTRDEAIKLGIARAINSLTEEEAESAFSFLYEYCRTHQFFNGGEPLEAWRNAHGKLSEKNWRNKWGGVMIIAHRSLGWVRALHHTKATSTQSHTERLMMWRSTLYAGKKWHFTTGGLKVALGGVRKQIVTGEVSMLGGLQKVYALGWNSAVKEFNGK